MRQNGFAARALPPTPSVFHPRPLGGAYSAPPEPLTWFGEGEGKAGEGKGDEGAGGRKREGEVNPRIKILATALIQLQGHIKLTTGCHAQRKITWWELWMTFAFLYNQRPARHLEAIVTIM